MSHRSCRQRRNSWSRSCRRIRSCSFRRRRSWSRMTRHNCRCSCTCPNRCEQREATRLTVICKRGRGAGGQTDQLPEQPEAFSCRRAPSTPPVIADSCDERDEALSSDGITQPWTVESVIARWKSIAYRGPCIDLLRALSVEDIECSGDVWYRRLLIRRCTNI